MIKKIILIRHGESERDKTNPDRKITPRGIRQIQKAAYDIIPVVNGKKCEIISTATVRTVQSAKIISEKLGIPYSKTSPNLRVENINVLEKKYPKEKDITFLYFKIFEKGVLPQEIPSPKIVVKRFFKAFKGLADNEIAIVVGHSGALESFALYQDLFLSKTKLKRELKYGEFIVLTRN